MATSKCLLYHTTPHHNYQQLPVKSDLLFLFYLYFKLQHCSSSSCIAHEPGYVIMPGYDGKLDSSTDGDDDGMDDSLDASFRNGAPPPPCNISFEGEGLEVSFDMSSTSTFEYPSENLLVEEYDLSEVPGMESSVAGVSSAQSSIAPLSPGGLASYTPSKLKLNESFELGVSRSTVPHPPTPPKGKESLEEELSHVRPADESQTVTWSSENAPDMLF
ncbi:hypothetical protein Avbf_06482 [Armadillidium vulgare]|nr:hypothetical protein Avbf_06482 [Armadillidium vulgare]